MPCRILACLSALIALISCSNSPAVRLAQEVHICPQPFAESGIGTLGLAMDDNGNIYVGKNLAIYQIKPDGAISLFAALAAEQSNEDYTYTLITDLEFGADNCLYAAARDRILKITPSGEMTTLIKQEFEERNGFFGLAFDQSGNPYVSYLNTVQKINPNGTRSVFISGEAAGLKMDSIMGLEFDHGYRNLYLCETDYGRVVRFPIDQVGNPGKPETVFEDISYGPRYLKFTANGNLIIKDCPRKHFFAITPEKTVKIIADEVNQKFWGLESFVVDAKDHNRVYANIWNGTIYSFYPGLD